MARDPGTVAGDSTSLSTDSFVFLLNRRRRSLVRNCLVIEEVGEFRHCCHLWIAFLLRTANRQVGGK